MQPIKFSSLLKWILEEYSKHRSIFGIPQEKFYKCGHNHKFNILNETISNPIGPAAGPHTQLTQNIISAYLTGARFFELKTVQKMDELEIDKPCIDAHDECYNIEWSQELKLEQSYDEYLKAWIIIHLLQSLLWNNLPNERNVIFNMSVGYDLEGIKSARVIKFIDGLIYSGDTELFQSHINEIHEILKEKNFKKYLCDSFGVNLQTLNIISDTIQDISKNVSNSITLSTMHGCPPDEIESIAKYLIGEKGLHTYVKLNPTLLGYATVKSILTELGYSYVQLSEESFSHDLQCQDAVPMLKRLNEFAAKNNKIFGVKLSNTLGVHNSLKRLSGEEMYLSGRALFPLTINLASKLASDFNGDINISYSGGANVHNTLDILNCGIKPVTYATDLLKPGGYFRLKHISDMISVKKLDSAKAKIDVTKLKQLADSSLKDSFYKKERREISSIKLPKKLKLFDCFISPCQEACPIHQDVAEYINLVEEKRFEEAFELIVSKNALPNITGYICDHQCMYHCTRWDYDAPVMIREIKKTAAEKGYSSFVQKFKSKFSIKQNGIKVAIIGAGPFGLSAAYFLAKEGFDVTIFESEMKAGGIVQNILPSFRLPQSAIDKDIKFIEELGVRFVFGVDSNFSISKLKKEGYKYIYIAIGASISNSIEIDSTDKNIFDALEFLRDYKGEQRIELGKNVAVIGGGNSAMDGARAAVRYGDVENVYIIYRRTKEYMPADREEFLAAIKDGVILKELLLPLKFENKTLTCQKMMLAETGKDGRRNVIPINDEYETIDIDTVISAIGEHTDSELLVKNNIQFGLNLAINISENTNETQVENVFIGGDALRGPATVVEAIADGRKTADAIIRKENVTAAPLHTIGHYIFDTNAHEKKIIHKKGMITNQILDDMIIEAGRCMSCNFICNKCVEVCPNRANFAIDINILRDSFKDNYQILHIDALCNECGNCETFCPYEGAPYKEKFILFWEESKFDRSPYDGFYIKTDNKKSPPSVKIRYQSQNSEIELGKDGIKFKETSNYKIITKEFDLLVQYISHIYKSYKYLLPE